MQLKMMTDLVNYHHVGPDGEEEGGEDGDENMSSSSYNDGENDQGSEKSGELQSLEKSDDSKKGSDVSSDIVSATEDAENRTSRENPAGSAGSLNSMVTVDQQQLKYKELLEGFK